MSQTEAHELPPELWIQALSCLSILDACTCRLVSRAFSSLAMPATFASLTVVIGADQRVAIQNGVPLDEAAAQANRLDEERFARTSGLVARIMSDPFFAAMVKSLQVHTPLICQNRVSQIVRLVAVIPCLRQLQSLAWYDDGRGEKIDGSVWQTILCAFDTHCPSLRVCALPMLSLPHLPDATRNRISGLFATSTAHHKRESSWCTTTMTSLHSLRTYGRRLSDIPVSRLPNVTELEIKYLNTSNGYAGLGAALGELPQLRSLSLMNIQRSWVRTNVFSEVASAMPLLPNLSALAINHTYCLDRFPPSTVPLFCKILRGHAKLRRVYWNYALDSSDLVTYMEMIATHTDLEAFHISVWDGLTDSLLSFVCRHLSPQLSILSLSSVRNGCSDDRTIFSGLWTYFTDLSFLSVQIHGGLNTAVTVQDVIRGARRVQVVGLEVGYVGQFREVIYPNGEPVLLPAWPARKIKLYEIEDFGCESWDWFMRHHLF